MLIRCYDNNDNVVFEGPVEFTDDDTLIFYLAGKLFSYETTLLQHHDSLHIYRASKLVTLRPVKS